MRRISKFKQHVDRCPRVVSLYRLEVAVEQKQSVYRTRLSLGMFGRSIARVMQFNMIKTRTTLSKDFHAIRRQQSCRNLQSQIAMEGWWVMTALATLDAKFTHMITSSVLYSTQYSRSVSCPETTL